MDMNKSRTTISQIVAHIEPLDEAERVVVADVLSWIESGAELFRRVKPDVPSKHLVSYFVLVDRARRSLLLVDHRKAGLWLPTGGHVEPDEDPHQTVLRELEEELGSRAASAVSVATLPLLVTVAQTRGAGSHTDVSLWYVVWADETMELDPDPREFAGHRWMTFDEILARPLVELDPAMHRFVCKLEGRL
jgi:8-oxo-dGTP pyrophosphatase MutT (NUDIX family)